MAELGDFLTQGATSTAKVTVDMMDYKFVDKCDDPTVLRSVLKELRSGREGHYPHLNAHVEKRLLEVMPKRERDKVARMKADPTGLEIGEEELELAGWVTGIGATDASLRATEGSGTVGASNLAAPPSGDDIFSDVDVVPLPGGAGAGAASVPPPRNSSARAQWTRPLPGPAAPAAAAAPREKGDKLYPEKELLDNKTYFREWDKFDADAACESVDAEERAAAKAVAEAKAEAKAKAEARAARRAAALADLREDLDVAARSPAERTHLAEREKQKGNECYRAGEVDEALLCYSRSLAYHDASCIVFSNRAMAHIKLGNLESAEADCTRSLELDPSYLKARSRRGMTRHRRGNFKGAMEDFAEAMEMAPEAQRTELMQLMLRSKEKYEDAEGERATAGHAPAVSKAAKAKAASSKKAKAAASGAAFGKGFMAEKPVCVPVERGDVPALPAGWGRVPIAGAAAVEVAAASPAPLFKRIAVVDDDSDSETDEDVPINANANAKTVRIPIGADSDSASASEDEGVVLDDEELVGVPSSTAAPSSITFEEESPETSPNAQKTAEGGERFTRVSIGVDEDDDSEDEDEDADAAAGGLDEWEAEGLKRQGVELCMQGEYAKATPLFEAALASLPAGHAAATPLRNNLCACALARSDFAAVVEHAGAVLAEDASNVKALLRRGSALESLGDRAAALLDYRKVLAIDPAVDDAVQGAVRCGADAEDDADADAASAQAKTQGNALMQAGDLAGAVAAYDRAVDADPCNAAALNNRALAKLKLGRFGEAIDDASGVLELDPANAKALYRRASARTKLGGPALDGALDDLARVLQLVPGHPTALAERAAVASERDVWRRAEAEAERLEAERAAAAAAPPPPPPPPAAAPHRVAIAVEDDSEDEDAGAAAAAAPPMPPPPSAAARSANHKDAGNACMKRGDVKAALVEYDLAVESDPANAAALNNRALAKLKGGDAIGAENDATKVLALERGNLKARFRRGSARLAQGSKAVSLDGAVADFDAVLAAEPGNKPARALRAQALAALAETRSKVIDVAKPASNPSARRGGAGGAAAAAPSAGAAVSEMMARPAAAAPAAAPASPALPVMSPIKVVSSDSPKAKKSPGAAAAAPAKSPAKSPGAVTPRKIALRKATVPETPAKTLYELERVWRDLKGTDGAFAEYLSTFKSSTFKKLYKVAMNPDILLSTFEAADALGDSNPKASAIILKGVTKMEGFAMAVTMMSAEEKALAASALRKASAGGAKLSAETVAAYALE